MVKEYVAGTNLYPFEAPSQENMHTDLLPAGYFNWSNAVFCHPSFRPRFMQPLTPQYRAFGLAKGLGIRQKHIVEVYVHHYQYNIMICASM